MKKYLFILMVGLLALLALGNPGMAAAGHAERHPELVSGSSQVALASQPELVSIPAPISTGPLASADVSGAADVKIAFEQTSSGEGTLGSFVSNHWGVLVMGFLGFLDVVARLTPTEKDNSIINLLTTVVNALIPNFRKGGGKF